MVKETAAETHAEAIQVLKPLQGLLERQRQLIYVRGKEVRKALPALEKVDSKNSQEGVPYFQRLVRIVLNLAKTARAKAATHCQRKSQKTVIDHFVRQQSEPHD